MKNTPIIVGAIVLILGVGYLATNSNSRAPESVTQELSTEIVSDTEAFATEKTTAPDKVATTESATAPGVYAAYDANVIAQSDADHILLFFKASWCPSCRALDADILENADAIPAGVEIYTVDYDTATDLKRQYGVTTQHSIIEISASGEALSSISHGLTLDDVLSTI